MKNTGNEASLNPEDTSHVNNVTSLQGTVLVTMSTDTEVNFQKTWNVLAYTPKFESSDTTIVVSGN